MKNMKIKVETDELGESNLDEIVVELEKRGCIPYLFCGENHVNFIATMNNTYTDFGGNELCDAYCGVSDLTTLAELRSMNIETLKEMWDEWI